ncbi:MAG TPA: hypothetical protein VKY91_03045 [Vulgatibacteraceae bacterium]|nr:hypothetical protein [Vulgatibacteraceae bacterium]
MAFDGNPGTDPHHESAGDGGGDVPDARPWWFAALAGGVVVVALVGLTLLVATSGDDGEDPQAAASPSREPATPSAAAPAAPPATAVPSPGAPDSAAPARPVKRWSGELTLNGPRTRRDLDTVPPRASTRAGEPDIRGDWLKTLVEAESGALVALMKPESRPGALACRDAAASTGSDETDPVDTGDVVCVLTARGTVARLVITDASQTSTSPTITADVVIWSVPGAGQ